MSRHRSGYLVVLACLVCLVSVTLLAGTAAATPTGGVDANTTAHATFPVTLTDATGTNVTVETRPERVTTTNPSAAQTMWALGAESQVVGVTGFAGYLDGAANRTNVSANDAGVSPERVIDTEPDLVLAPNATPVETVETLRADGLTVYHFRGATDFEDVADKTRIIGELTGNTASAAETNDWMWENVAEVEASVNNTDRPQVLYPLLGGFAVGGDTFINEIITTAGGENVAASEFDGYRPLNAETVIDLDPEVLLVTDQTEGQIVDSEPYSLTSAAETGRVATLEVSYLNQPAPRSVVYATQNLSTQLRDGGAAAPADTESTGVSAPGFGVGVAIAALLAVALVGRFSRRRQ